MDSILTSAKKLVYGIGACTANQQRLRVSIHGDQDGLCEKRHGRAGSRGHMNAVQGLGLESLG